MVGTEPLCLTVFCTSGINSYHLLVSCILISVPCTCKISLLYIYFFFQIVCLFVFSSSVSLSHFLYLCYKLLCCTCILQSSVAPITPSCILYYVYHYLLCFLPTFFCTCIPPVPSPRTLYQHFYFYQSSASALPPTVPSPHTLSMYRYLLLHYHLPPVPPIPPLTPCTSTSNHCIFNTPFSIPLRRCLTCKKGSARD